MPRKIDGLEKMTVTLKRGDLFAAQVLATKRGVSPKTTGNTSAFLRYLITNYLKEHLQ